MEIPKFDSQLDQEQLDLLESIAKSCRSSILQMVTNADSGHPGGSLSCIDYLAVLYTFIISQTGEDVVVSNGHISPAVYAILAELGYITKKDVIETFRKVGSIYEGHVTRHVPGIVYGTGPLGVGVSVASAIAIGEKLHRSNKKVYGLMGDGEAQEGQVYEMMNFASKYDLNNFILFVDANKVQLTDSLAKIMPTNIHGHFEAAGWVVYEVDGHDYNEVWDRLSKSQNSDKPVLILGNTIMGKGVDFMESEGIAHKSTWHGKAPKPEQIIEPLKSLELTPTEQTQIDEFKNQIKWHPEKPNFPESLSKISGFDAGSPTIYKPDELTDCRTAYGKALLDLAEKNPNVVALTADLSTSVMTKFLQAEFPERHIECGISEQHMMSAAGGLSIKNFIPFVSTFGAFETSRAKDQARVNDINRTNVKMVATHCGLSVGEDGPTHQILDDIGAMLGHLNTMIIEPADPNQTDRIIRYIGGSYGNFYVRMGRHKIPVLTKEDGSIFYDENYKYEYGKSDLYREGSDLTIIVSGPMVCEAELAKKKYETENPGKTIEIIITSSMTQFDDTITRSINKTGKVLVIQDHNPRNGLGSQLANHILGNGISVNKFEIMGVEEYQLSGKPHELYEVASISSTHITKKITSLI